LNNQHPSPLNGEGSETIESNDKTLVSRVGETQSAKVCFYPVKEFK